MLDCVLSKIEADDVRVASGSELEHARNSMTVLKRILKDGR